MLMQTLSCAAIALVLHGNGNFNPSATPVGQGYFINVVSFLHRRSVMLLP